MNSNIDNSILPMMNNGYVDFSIDKSLKTSNSSTQMMKLDGINPSNSLKKRKRFSKEQLKVLEATFNENNYPNAAKLHELIDQLALPLQRVIVWFQNRRAKLKREQISERKNFNVPLTIGYPTNQFNYPNNYHNNYNNNGLLAIAQSTITQNLSENAPVYLNDMNQQVNQYATQYDSISNVYYYSQISTLATEKYPCYCCENSYGAYNTYYNQ